MRLKLNQILKFSIASFIFISDIILTDFQLTLKGVLLERKTEEI